MPFRAAPRLLLSGLLVSAAVVALHGPAAFAQSASDSDRDAAEAAQKAQAKADAKAAAPPPAIPGAVTDETTATSGHASADMEPTAALFDAINRGDIASAKEALGRGADLNGRNVLGQTPLDMSIDLNRSDITFLLLSMRNSEDGAPPASVETASGDVPAAGPAASSPRKGRHRKEPGAAPALAAAGGRHPTRQVADNGTPQPDVGFLGFGGS